MEHDNLTDHARKALHLARDEARRFRHNYIGTEHILLGLIKEGSGTAATVLKNLKVNLKQIALEVEKTLPSGTEPIPKSSELPFTDNARRVLELANEEARGMGQTYIGTEHMLLGLLGIPRGYAAQILQSVGIKLDRVREEVLNFASASFGFEAAETGATPKGKSKTPAVDAFSRDLTELARRGEIDPIIGREKEIERLIQVLSRRKKNNPVLLGEAGVGKTAIVEGLAQAVVQSTVPEPLRNRRIVALDLAMMVAGTKYRGQFEERIKAVMSEVRRAKNVIVFVDELHTIVGAGGAEGAIDASNVLKPALSRGELQCVGATTLDEYRKYIEKDSALERRFQTIIVEPPSNDETLEILKGLREKYEAHHNVQITDKALEDTVELSSRYIAGRYMPDKAIDVIDEAGARVRLKTMTPPPNLQHLEEKVTRLNAEKDEAVAAQDFERAANLRDKASQIRAKMERIRKEWQRTSQENKATVDENVIAEVVSSMTGIPLTRLESAEAERLLHAEDELHEMVVSQEEAIGVIAKAIRRSRSGLKDPTRPVGSFVFLGPSGVGKTHLARALAKFMFGDEDALIQVDMSEYMERHNASKLIGAPPGYVGYDEGGQLTEKIRRRPYSVVCLDEIEKAHTDVFNMLLQIMEEGRLTDSFGRHVDFRNVVLIMTSNIGAEVIKNQGGLGFRRAGSEMNYDNLKRQLMRLVEKRFRPEFLNRLDEVIVFRPLTKEDLFQIIELQLEEVRGRLREHGLTLELTQEAKDFLIEKGYHADFGARPLRRAVERHVEDKLSEEILKGNLSGKKHVVAKIHDDQVVFEAEGDSEEAPQAEDIAARA
jgi:ATP-dependent Clp protease ATP-binding subunit ClpC